MKKIIIFITLLLFVNSISATGLLVNETNITSVKVYGHDILQTFNLLNTEMFTFYNITLEDNPYVYMSKIDELNSGQYAQINSIIKSNVSIDNLKLRIRGLYTANVGSSNQTHIIDVDYYSGLSRCDFTIVKGDTVKWVSTVADDIVLRNAVTNNDITTITSMNNYSTKFESPTTLRYVFLRRGFTFTNVCTITVISDTGLVNNPDFDTFLNLSIRIIYNPTNISYNLLVRNYTLDIFASQDGVLTITNTGNNTARNVSLRSSWVTFNFNNFDLESGQTKGIVYTIKSLPNSTSETNKTHELPLTIDGNFNTINDRFFVFVNYGVIGNSSNQSNYASLLSLLTQFCIDNPTESFCQKNPNVVYVGNGTDTEFNVTYSQEQVKKIYEYIFQQGDEQKLFNSQIVEKLEQLTTKMENVSQSSLNASNTILQVQQDTNNTDSNTVFIIIISIMMAIMVAIIILIILIKRYQVREKLKVW